MPKKKQKRTSEERRQYIRDRVSQCLLGNIPKPTYFFNVGDKVRCRHDGQSDATVIAVLDEGTVYELSVISHKRDKIINQELPPEQINIFRFWYEVRKPERSNVQLATSKQFQLSYSQASLNFILYYVYHFGIDMDPEYQRDLIWNNDSNTLLIDSIFHNRDIGKFVLVEREWEEEYKQSGKMGKMYEILDGKQRLNAIINFYEDRFAYKELYYSDLCSADTKHFQQFLVNYARIENIVCRKQILELFVFLNKRGQAMSAEHLNRIEQMIDTK